MACHKSTCGASTLEMDLLQGNNVKGSQAVLAEAVGSLSIQSYPIHPILSYSSYSSSSILSILVHLVYPRPSRPMQPSHDMN